MKSWPRLLSDLLSKERNLSTESVSLRLDTLTYLRGTIVFLPKRKKKRKKENRFKMADEKRRKNSTKWWKRSLSNRCSRVLGACTTCYRRARIRFKTIRCGWGCLPLPLSAVLQPGTGERGREFSVASAKPHHHVPRLRAFQEFKNSRSRGVSLTANGKPFFFLFCSRNLHRHIFPPSPLLRYRLSESCISSEERLIILIAFLRISYHIRLTKWPLQ